jgi:hypothetical protein
MTTSVGDQLFIGIFRALSPPRLRHGLFTPQNATVTSEKGDFRPSITPSKMHETAAAECKQGNMSEQLNMWCRSFESFINFDASSPELERAFSMTK